MVYTQPPWRSGGGATTTKASANDGQPMPVLGRVGPLSSGLSTRALPAASFVEVRRACDHYQQKCSGRYHDNVAAARHLRELADEIRALIGPLEQEYEEATQRQARVASNVRSRSWLGSGCMCFCLFFPISLHNTHKPAAHLHRVGAQLRARERLLRAGTFAQQTPAYQPTHPLIQPANDSLVFHR